MLKASFQPLCKKICEIVNELLRTNRFPYRYVTKIQDNGTGHSFQQTPIPDYDRVFYHIYEKLPEYSALTSFLGRDESKKKFFFGWEQVGNSGSILQPMQLVYLLLEEMQWDFSNFEAVFPKFEQAISADKLVMEQRAYLSNLQIDFDEYRFSGGLVLKRLTVDDVNEALARDWFSPKTELIEHRTFLSIDHTFERKVYNSSQERRKEKETFPDSREDFRETVNLLRVIFNTNVLIREFNLSAKGFSVYKKQVSSMGFWNDVPNLLTVFSRKEVEDFDKFLISLKRLSLPKKKNTRLANAIEWFGGRVFRHRPQDRLLDIVVALETLFVSDDKELSYQFALRIASFLSDDPKKRQRIFDLTRAAYSLRSKMVHSGEMIEDKVRVGKVETHISTVISELEKYTVDSIKAVVNGNGSFLNYENEQWNSKILNNKIEKETA